MDPWKKYRRTGIAIMRPYIPGEDLSGISVSDADTPKEGDMISINPNNSDDQWLVAEAYFVENFEPVK